MFFLTLPKISVCILINYVPSSSTVPITRTLCHQLTVNGGIRLLQDIQWKKTGLSQVAENICSDLQHARASCAIRSRHHEDPFFIQILSLQQSFEDWAACKVAHYQHRTAWVRRDHARPFTLRRRAVNTHRTYTQSEMEAPAKSTPTPPRGQGWNQGAHLAYFGQPLQTLLSPPVTLGRAGNYNGSRSRKTPPVLKLRNIWGNLFTINTNRSWGICKSFMIFKASGLVC